MQIKRSGKTIFGAKLTAAEKKAMDIEIQKQIAEFDRKNFAEVDAIVLWVLFAEFDFTSEQLRQYYDAFHIQANALLERYELETSDDIWLCTRMLKEQADVDIEAWHRESQ